VGIIDTKYKRLDSSSVSGHPAEADTYQMLAYGLRFHCSQILLLYPQHTLSPVRNHYCVHESLISIRTATLNLRVPLGDPSLLINEFRSIITPVLSEVSGYG
jgi:5-methylcytosine-specific restriction endonuclease McrBC regulatory subunit McrC